MGDAIGCAWCWSRHLCSGGGGGRASLLNPGAVVERCSDAGFLSHFDLPPLLPSFSPTMQGLIFQCRRMYRLHLQRPPRVDREEQLPCTSALTEPWRQK